MSLSDRPLCEHGRTSREGCVRCDETSVVLTEAGKEALKEAPSLFIIMVHQRCAKPDDVLLDRRPVTRSVYDADAAERRRKFAGSKPFDPRKAWW